MKNISDPELSKFFSDPIKKSTSEYEASIDEWIWLNEGGIYEIIPKKEVDDAYKRFNIHYGIWDDDLIGAPKPKEESIKKIDICRYPSFHTFKKEVFFQYVHNVCEKCGYSPTLIITNDYETCHEEYLEWKKTN